VGTPLSNVLPGPGAGQEHVRHRQIRAQLATGVLPVQDPEQLPGLTTTSKPGLHDVNQTVELPAAWIVIQSVEAPRDRRRRLRDTREDMHAGPEIEPGIETAPDSVVFDPVRAPEGFSDHPTNPSSPDPLQPLGRWSTRRRRRETGRQFRQLSVCRSATYESAHLYDLAWPAARPPPTSRGHNRAARPGAVRASGPGALAHRLRGPLGEDWADADGACGAATTGMVFLRCGWHGRGRRGGAATVP
jgi:hypothetical protein